MKGWNHRILAHKSEGEEEVFFQVHEVHYDEEGNPETYGSKPALPGGETVEDLVWTLNKMKQSRRKRILWAGDRFPEVYNEEL